MANVNLQLGSWLVGFRPDVDRTAATLRALFGPYLDDSSTVDESSFSLRRPGSRMRPRPGELYIGGHLAARSDSLPELVQALAWYTSGVAAEPDGLTTTNLRAFTRDGRVVLTDTIRPHLVDDDELPEGVSELHFWEPRVDPATARLVAPDLLSELRWDDAGIPIPPVGPHTYAIAGVVVRRGDEDISGLRDAWRTGSGNLDGWRDVLGDLHASSLTRTALSAAEYGEAVDGLLRQPN